MNTLKYWKEKIGNKRKNTDFRKFLLEIGSWTTLVFNKYDGLTSRYPKTDRVSVCHFKEFDKRRDDYIKKGFEYDFSKDFFQNFSKLFQETPLPNLFHVGENENCDYVDTAVYAKNSYLSFLVTLESENVFYSFMVRENSINVFNSFYVITNNEYIYFSSYILYSYKIFYSKYIKNSSNIWFSTNLTGCKECIGCDNLQNVSYYIENKKYSKERYIEKKKKILEQKNTFLEKYKNLNKKGQNYNSTDSSGNFVLDSENIENGYGVFNMVNGRNIMFSGSNDTSSNCYDLIFGGKGTNDCYGVSNFGGSPDNIYLSYNVGYGSNIFYSYGITECSYCIGCVGLKNKSYCILNKQYTKQEWEILADRIFSGMEEQGILGNYFPGKMNPFYFNETFAGLIGDFTQEEVEVEGYMRREKKIKIDIPDDANMIGVSELNNYQGYDKEGNRKIDSEILKKVIGDEKGNYYRIVQTEYDFLVKHGLPLPEIHWMERMKLNFGG